MIYNANLEKVSGNEFFPLFLNNLKSKSQKINFYDAYKSKLKPAINVRGSFVNYLLEARPKREYITEIVV